MQRKRNIRLLLILTLMVLAIIWLGYSDKARDNSGIARNLFKLAQQQEITDVFLTGHASQIHFKYRDGRWRLNDSLYLDKSMRDVFFSVVSQVEVARPVPQAQRDSVVNVVKEQGVDVRITFGEQDILHYKVGGNKKDEISWMMGDDEVPYLVHIPGYQSFIAGMFMVPEIDWRSRFLVNRNFAMIGEIRIDYPEPDQGFVLQYRDGFYHMQDREADSTATASFLDGLAFAQVDRFLSEKEVEGQYKNYLTQDRIVAKLSLGLVGGKVETISFFKLPDQRKLLVRMSDGSLSLADRRRLANLLKLRGDFD